MPLNSHSPSHSHTDQSKLSLTLSLSQPHDPNPLSLTPSLFHSPTHSHASHSHPLHPHTDTLSPSLLSHSPSTLSLNLHSQSPLFHIHQLRQKNRDCIKCSSQSFDFLQSTQSLEKKKKVSPFMQNAKCVSPFGCWETVGKIKETLVLVHFFSYFGFYIEFLIELLKKIEALLFFEIELVCGIGLCF